MRYLNGIWLDFQLLMGVWATVDPRNLLQCHNLHNLQQVQQYVDKMPYSCCSKTHNLEHQKNWLSPQSLSFQNQLLRTQRHMQQLMQLHGNLRSAPTHLFRKNALLLANNSFALQYVIFATVLKFAPLARVFSYLLQYHWYYLLLLLGYWGLLNIKGDTGRQRHKMDLFAYNDSSPDTKQHIEKQLS